ncbi:MAG: nucleoside hydrolase [Solobacterium sp.]|nr:nucleoside hydrolase [Solobacterium sp.]
MAKRKIIIDCDPGHDDIMAILMALAHPEELELLGITTVAGNNHMRRVTENLLRTLTYLGRTDIPVSMGSDTALVLGPEPQDAHGVTGLDGFDFPEPAFTPVKEHAVEFMKNCILSSEDKVTIVALAPLTNVALLVLAYPEVKDRIEQIVLMGGSVYRGNMLARSEFNIYADPHAAEAVMRCGVPVVIAPLEVCDDCLISEDDIKRWEQIKKPAAQLCAGLMNFFAGYGRKRGWTEFTVFDLVTIMYLLYPDRFEGFRSSCHVVPDGKYTRGMTVIDEDGNGHVYTLMKADRKYLNERFLEAIDRLDEGYPA